MTRPFLIGALTAITALAGCEVEAPDAGRTAEAPVEAAVAAQPSAGEAVDADLAAAAQVIANGFVSRIDQNLGGGWRFSEASATGSRVDLTIEVPVAGRRYRNFDRPGDPLRADLRRANCSSDTISAFLLLGGVMVVEIEGRDGVRIGSYRFDDPC